MKTFRDMVIDRFEDEGQLINKEQEAILAELAAVPPDQRTKEKMNEFQTRLIALLEKYKALGERALRVAFFSFDDNANERH